jgi:hypothetical protein
MVAGSLKKKVFKMPYFQALKAWNQKCNPLKKKAWVVPYGKMRNKNNRLYDQIVDIRQGINVECSSSVSSSLPSTKSPTPLPSTKSPSKKTTTSPSTQSSLSSTKSPSTQPPQPSPPSKKLKILAGIFQLAQIYGIQQNAFHDYFVPGNLKKQFLDDIDRIALQHQLDSMDFEDYWNDKNTGPYLAINYQVNDVPQHLKSQGVKLLPNPHIPLFKSSSHFLEYKRAGYKHGKKYTFTYKIDKAPKKLKLPSNQITMGEGSYASVVKGEWNNKECAVKFQIVDAQIPQPFGVRTCVQKGDNDCFSMSKYRFNNELKSIEDAATVGVGPKLYYAGFVDCDKVEVSPQINNPLAAPKELGLLVMEIVPGKPIYNVINENNGKLKKDKQFQQEITSDILNNMKKLYDKFQYFWDDMHFGNIMYDVNTKKLTIIDIGDLRKTGLDWDATKKIYLRKINSEF